MSSPAEAAPLPATGSATRRWAAAASLVAAALLGFALASPTFWRGEQGDAASAVGLLRIRTCSGGSCHATSLVELGEGAGSWARLGMAAAVGAGLALAAQLALAVACLRGGPPRRRKHAATATALFTCSIGAVFVIAEPGLGLGFGPAMWAYFGGAAIGAAAATSLHPTQGARSAS